MCYDACLVELQDAIMEMVTTRSTLLLSKWVLVHWAYLNEIWLTKRSIKVSLFDFISRHCLMYKLYHSIFFYDLISSCSHTFHLGFNIYRYGNRLVYKRLLITSTSFWSSYSFHLLFNNLSNLKNLQRQIIKKKKNF